MADFRFGLNTSTIQPTGLMEKIRIAAAAGYEAIELWAADVEAHVERGGTLADVASALDDAGLARPSMISLKDWCPENDAEVAQALETARRRLALAGVLGVERIVAGPPHGDVDVGRVTDRYARLLELSVEMGVPASLEFLGFVKTINTLDVAWEIARATGNAAATVVVDAWHLFRGGSSDGAVDALPVEAVSIVHWDDAPAAIPRQEQTDADRVYPGDGILDLPALAATLSGKGYRGTLSLELFHPALWEQDPEEVARTGLEKMRGTVG